MKMKKLLSVILAAVMLLGCMSITAFAAGSPDLSMLTTGKKIMFGTQSGTPVEWVIGGDGTTGMSAPEGCIALVSSRLVASDVKFNANFSNEYSTSNLRTVVESAVTFTTDEQAVIQSRTLPGNSSDGSDCDGVAGNSVTAAVWAPTTKDAYALQRVRLVEASSGYWLCSPGYTEERAAIVNEDGDAEENGVYVYETQYGVRASLYIDLSKVYGTTAVEGKENTYTLNLTAPEEPENDFLTSFTLDKDYNDKYTANTKSTKVNETVSFAITPVTTGAPAFDDNGVFTMTVADGAGSAEVDLPDVTDITSVGEYWYEIEETAGTTAGVTYNDATYYLHLIVSYKDGEFGFSSAAIHTTENGEGDDDAKITLVSNSYGEGTLTVAQDTTVNGEASDEDAFTAEVTFTAPTGTTVTGEIKYGDLTIDPEDWDNGSVTVEIELKGGDTVLFENIPDGVTYTVEQTESNEDKGYTLDSVEFDNEDEDGDSVTDLVASGTIGDLTDIVTITNSKTVPIDVGVILENGAFIILALGAIAAGVWLVISKRKKALDAE